LSLIFRLHGGSLSDILEMRRLLESEAAALAAERIAPEQAESLTQLIDNIRECTDEAESIRLDKEFHLKIAEYSGNVLLLVFLTAISSLLERSIQDGRQAIMRTFRSHNQLLSVHKEICRAITAGKAKAATTAVNRHFKMIIDNLPE
jgi:GntR family transcriptional repressor for pyruvate dehydrogenase complex